MKKACLIDISRYRVPTLSRMKTMLERLSGYGYNEIFFNIEHIFRIKEHPLPGSEADGYTEVEFGELDNHARTLGLLLIPVFQSLGHMFHILKWETYAELRETDDYWSIRPCFNKSLVLLKDYYTALTRCFRSEYIHVGGDEVYDFARGKSLPMLKDGKTKEQLYIEHFMQLENILAGLNRKMMLWGDMLEGLDGKTGRELMACLSPDTIICYWHYGENPMPEIYNSINNKVYVCPGIHAWRGLFVRKKEAENNLISMSRVAKIINPHGVIITDWGDCGHVHPPALSENLLRWALQVFTRLEPETPIVSDTKLDALINMLNGIHSGEYLDSSAVSDKGENELVTRLLLHEYIFRGKGFLTQSDDMLIELIDRTRKLELIANEMSLEKLSENDLPIAELTRGLVLLIRQTTLLKKRAELHLAFRRDMPITSLENSLMDLIFEGRRWFADWMNHWLESSQPMGLFFHIHYWNRTEENIITELDWLKSPLSINREEVLSIYSEPGWRNLYSICDVNALRYDWKHYGI